MIKPTPKRMSPIGHGSNDQDGHLVAVTCELPCSTPASVLQSVECSCAESRCSSACKCRANNLLCTEMCGCTGVEEFCDNLYYIVADDASGEISDEMLMTVDDLYLRM